ncbi:hypothetical protein AVEN_227720-1 [Araneus ventricosus]|uniref:Uncharacterized protein n=1 Tax=Araneus ventricosus TaxID=182803 RepID=A0A4Y2A3Z3_ARAVE|nr:hypothetical protein AVEN_227720-1 [Araneus ventricosus]
MMKFSYTIVHIPGKELFATNALSRNPQKVPYKREDWCSLANSGPCAIKPQSLTHKREELEAEIDAFIQMITSSPPTLSRRLDELRAAQLKDETCQKPSKKEVDTLCAP